MKITNLTALFHLAILPFLVYFISQKTLSYSFAAILLLSISVFIDFIEKSLERKKTVHSFLHPIADKMVVLVLLFIFALRGSFSPVVFAVLFLRDVTIGIIRILASRDDVIIKSSNFYGKLITSFQFVLVFSLLIKDFVFSIVIFDLTGFINATLTVFSTVSLLLAVISIVHCGYVYGKGLRNRRKLGKRIEQEKIIILANRKSSGYRDVYRRHLLKLFAKRRKAQIIYLSSGKNMFAGVAKLVKEAKQVIIAGGDGSFEGALNCKSLQKKSLGFFPLGAGNSFYSYFYKGKRFEYLRSRFKFQEVLLDVLELDWDQGKIETLFLGLGSDAEVIKAIKDRKQHTLANYISASLAVAKGPKVQYDFTCTVDGREYYWKNGIGLLLGKVPYIGFGIRSLLGSLKEDDGNILGMAIVNTHSPIFNKTLRVWSLLLTQMSLAKAPLIPLKGKEFIVKSEQLMPLHAGGEFLGYTKQIKVKVVRKQKVLMI